MMNSPYGGTTSLPQYLQKRTQDQTQPKTAPQTTASGPTPPPATQQPMAPGANTPLTQSPKATPQGAMPAVAPPQSPGMVGSQPIPPAPPPPAAPAVGMAPGGTQVTRTAPPAPQAPNTPAGSFGLPDLIKRMLSGEGRYDNATIQGMRDSSRNRLEDERRTIEDRLRADAASRGMFRSTQLSTSLGDANERFLRQLSDSENDINARVADARQQDLLSAINAAYGFGQGELQNQQLQQNYMLALAQLGMLGGPTIPGAVGDFGSLPGPGVPGNDGFYEWLSTMFPQQKAA